MNHFVCLGKNTALRSPVMVPHKLWLESSRKWVEVNEPHLRWFPAFLLYIFLLHFLIIPDKIDEP